MSPHVWVEMDAANAFWVIRSLYLLSPCYCTAQSICDDILHLEHDSHAVSHPIMGPCSKLFHILKCITEIWSGIFSHYMRALCKVCEPTLLLQVGTFWRCIDGLFFKVWQVMHLLQCSTLFSKMCCRPLITLKFLASELPFHGWKS